MQRTNTRLSSENLKGTVIDYPTKHGRYEIAGLKNNVVNTKRPTPRIFLSWYVLRSDALLAQARRTGRTA